MKIPKLYKLDENLEKYNFIWNVNNCNALLLNPKVIEIQKKYLKIHDSNLITNFKCMINVIALLEKSKIKKMIIYDQVVNNNKIIR